MNKLFSPSPLLEQYGLPVIRFIIGAIVAYHGLEVFSPGKIAGYAEWDSIKNFPFPKFMVYLAKGIEFAGGICLALGLFTRPAAILIFFTMMFICFKVGSGKFYYEDQAPFMYGLLSLVFFFTGPVSLALDNLFFKKK